MHRAGKIVQPHAERIVNHAPAAIVMELAGCRGHFFEKTQIPGLGGSRSVGALSDLENAGCFRFDRKRDQRQDEGRRIMSRRCSFETSARLRKHGRARGMDIAQQGSVPGLLVGLGRRPDDLEIELGRESRSAIGRDRPHGSAVGSQRCNGARKQFAIEDLGEQMALRQSRNIASKLLDLLGHGRRKASLPARRAVARRMICRGGPTWPRVFPAGLSATPDARLHFALSPAPAHSQYSGNEAPEANFAGGAGYSVASLAGITPSPASHWSDPVCQASHMGPL